MFSSNVVSCLNHLTILFHLWMCSSTFEVEINIRQQRYFLLPYLWFPGLHACETTDRKSYQQFLSSLPVAVWLLMSPLAYCRSYCERVFRDCRLQTCYVQSPAYPGVYPRGLHCRYHLNTRLPFIKLYIENEEFNIDGQRCENIMTCPMRPISSGEKHCPYDYIKIYDGINEGSPVIGKI